MSNYKSYQPCVACGTMAVDRCFHHIISRGSGGKENVWNKIPLCLQHHNEVHNVAMMKFSRTYWSVHEWLVTHGWEFELTRDKWVHYGQ